MINLSIVHILSKHSTSDLTNVKEGDSQPNAVDLRLDKVFAMFGTFMIDNDNKHHRVKTELRVDSEGYYNLPIGSYEIAFENQVEVGPDEAGFVITRSTLNRNGIFVTSGLYDSGYEGPMAAVLHVNGGPARIKRGTRIAQYVTWKAESLSQYDGDYGKSGDMDAHLKGNE